MKRTMHSQFNRPTRRVMTLFLGVMGAVSVGFTPLAFAQTPTEMPGDSAPTEVMPSPEANPETPPPSEETPPEETPSPATPQAAPASQPASTTPNSSAVTFFGLSPGNMLVRFGQANPSRGRSIPVKGIDGTLQGIDYRPANGLLYGVSDTDKIYTINPNTGAATQVGTLSTSFDGGYQSGFDFNPQLDRLRINSLRQNFSVNVDNGTAAAQTALAYIAGDRNAGKDPNVTSAAYTNNVAGAASTQLFTIDYDLDVLALQDPPPTGQLRTIGSLGVNFSPIGGFDIVTNAQGMNRAFAVSGSTLYTIDLTTGRATQAGTVPRSDFIGLAATTAPNT
jgi:Domain of unknown function (DUF4394)